MSTEVDIISKFPRAREAILQRATVHIIPRHHGRLRIFQSSRSLLGQGIDRRHHRRRQWYVAHNPKATPLVDPHLLTQRAIGIGLAIASALHQNGASKIYIIGRRQTVLEDAIAKLESSPSAPAKDPSAPPVLSAISADVTNLDSMRSAVAQITRETGHVDVLINNAGILGPKSGAPIHEAQTIEQVRDAMLLGWDEWSDVFSINTQAVVGVSALFLPLLEAANTRRGWASGRVSGTGNPRARDAAKLEGIGADADDDRMAHIITVASVASYMRWISTLR